MHVLVGPMLRLTATSPPKYACETRCSRNSILYIVYYFSNFEFFGFSFCRRWRSVFPLENPIRRKSNVGTPHKTPKKLFRIIFFITFLSALKEERTQKKNTTRLPLTAKRNERNRKKKHEKIQ